MQITNLNLLFELILVGCFGLLSTFSIVRGKIIYVNAQEESVIMDSTQKIGVLNFQYSDHNYGAVFTSRSNRTISEKQWI